MGIDEILERWEDSFERLVAQGTRNNLDIATQYNFNPERARLFRNDARQFPQYDTIAQFTDTGDTWALEPDAGDTMHIESAESGTYVVNYVMQASWAFQLNQSLTSGDVLRIGPYNGTDGWVFEQRGADHTDLQGDIIQSRGGTEVTLATDVELARPTTSWTRLSVEYNWYGVGNQVWTQTYTDDGTQVNTEFAKSSRDGEKGPETGNLNLWQEIHADSATTGLELDCGSMGMITLGDPTSLNRDKPQFEEITVEGTANAWEPILAIRVDPDNDDVNMQLALVNILSYAANATIELVVVSFDASKTNATGWGIPEYHHAENSALQSTTDISQVANVDGTVEDLGAGTMFGGHTLAASIDVDGGNISGTEGTVNQNRQEKKAVLESDHVVFLARTGTTGSLLSFVWDVDQNY